jgi:hypothetical protein
MNAIHCHICGGSVSDPMAVAHRLASAIIVAARPQNTRCECTPPVVFGPPSGYMSWPGLPSMAKVAS